MAKSGHKAALAAVLVFGSRAVWADVTPEEVWQNWQDTATAQGQKVTAASTAMEGDTLTVSGIVIETANENGKGSIAIEEMQFTDNGDGTVAVVLPDAFPVRMQMPAAKDVAGATPVDMTLNIKMPGADITASGVPDSLSYQTTMPVVEITTEVKEGEGDGTAAISVKMTDATGNYLTEAAESGRNITEDFAAKTFDLSVKTTGANSDSDVAVTMSLSDLAGKANLNDIPASGMADLETALADGLTLDLDLSYGIGSLDVSGKDAGDPIKMTGAMGGGNLVMAMAARSFHYDSTSKSLSLNFAGTDKVSNAEFTFSGALADFTSQLDMQGANWMQTDDFAAALKAGLKMTGAVGLGASSFDFNSDEAGKSTKVKASVGGADTTFAFDAAALHYGLGSKAISVSVTSPEIPVPDLSVDLSEVAFELAMPVSKSDSPAPFTYQTRIIDLKVPEALWGMVDPAGTLSHDPATLIIDTKGTATLTSDLMDDAMALEGGASAPPGMLNSMDLTQLLLKIAGAEVSAVGAFTFDNSDMTTIPDMPYPTGKIDIKALGVNALIDKLVGMGLLPEDQAMQGRMMLSMFANTSAEKDEITSTLEFKDKHFFANGQQLQ